MVWFGKFGFGLVEVRIAQVWLSLVEFGLVNPQQTNKINNYSFNL